MQENHYCLIQDHILQMGTCQPYCDILGVKCPNGYECSESKCTPIDGYCEYDHDCDSSTQYCKKRPSLDYGTCQTYCYYPGQMCPAHTYCDDDPQSTTHGYCIYDYSCEHCSINSDCPTDKWCYMLPGYTEGCCTPYCADDDDCFGDLVCTDEGKCGVGIPDVCEDMVCESGYVCDPYLGQCVINCPPVCDEGWSCNASSAPNCVEGCEPPPAGICGLGLAPCCPPQKCNVLEWIYGLYGICI